MCFEKIVNLGDNQKKDSVSLKCHIAGRYEVKIDIIPDQIKIPWTG